MATLSIQIEAVAVGWQIYAIAHNPLALGYVGLAQFIPMAALFFVAVDVVDHHNRCRILTITYAAQAVATALLLMLTCLSVQDERLFYIALVLLRSARAFGQPAAHSFLPQHNHQLVRDGVALLADMWKFRVTTPDQMTAAMALVPMPEGLPYPANDEGCGRLQADLQDKHNIVLNPAFAHQGRIWLRITAQIYKDLCDYEKVGKGILALRSNFG